MFPPVSLGTPCRPLSTSLPRALLGTLVQPDPLPQARGSAQAAFSRGPQGVFLGRLEQRGKEGFQEGLRGGWGGRSPPDGGLRLQAIKSERVPSADLCSAKGALECRRPHRRLKLRSHVVAQRVAEWPSTRMTSPALLA